MFYQLFVLDLWLCCCSLSCCFCSASFSFLLNSFWLHAICCSFSLLDDCVLTLCPEFLYVASRLFFCIAVNVPSTPGIPQFVSSGAFVTGYRYITFTFTASVGFDYYEVLVDPLNTGVHQSLGTFVDFNNPVTFTVSSGNWNYAFGDFLLPMQSSTYIARACNSAGCSASLSSDPMSVGGMLLEASLACIVFLLSLCIRSKSVLMFPLCLLSLSILLWSSFVVCLHFIVLLSFSACCICLWVLSL